MLKTVVAIALLALLSACAQTPDVSFNYYPTKALTHATITQTIFCKPNKESVVTVNSLSAKTTYSADTNADSLTFKIKELDRIFADASIDFTFTTDGRLSAINQSTTGKGATIIKSAVSFASSVLGIVKSSETGVQSDVQVAKCKIISAHGKNGVAQLSYQAAIDWNESSNSSFSFDGSNVNDPNLYFKLKDALPYLTLTSKPTNNSLQSVQWNKDNAGTGFANLELQQVKQLEIQFDVTPSEGEHSTLGPSKFYILAPTKITKSNKSSSVYNLPIPKAALFGGQTFKLNLSDAGTITSVKYGKTAGEGGAFDALGSVANQFESSSIAEQAKDAKAQADLIYQQQRLAKCIADPGECK